MIRVIKGPKPESLQIHDDEWNAEYVQAMHNWIQNGKAGPKPTPKYNQKDIKEALERDYHKKCGYCEAKINTVTHGHIEHFLPKAVFLDKTHSWENLLLACPKCNVSKSDKTTSIVNPSNIIDPKRLFSYDDKLKGIVIIVGLTSEAKNTIAVCGLNREDLSGDREKTLSVVRAYLELERLGNRTFLDTYLTNIENESFLGALRFYNLVS